MDATFQQQVAAGERFEFGKNWRRFLEVVGEDRIRVAEHSLREMLRRERLDGLSVLDVGSGSGLFSLAAVRLGAARVHSFDFDPQSVACTLEMKARFAPKATHWTVARGSVLDRQHLAGLGTWDLVYSWGVLHHTGAMWDALGNVDGLVASGGSLFIAIYNDQGLASRWWTRLKILYNSGRAGRAVVCAIGMPYLAAGGAIADLGRGRSPLIRYREYRRLRGMSILHDWVDWLGGYPFEVATPEQIVDFYLSRGYTLRRLKTCGGRMGCNEFVFDRRG